MEHIYLSQLLFKVNGPESLRYEVSLRVVLANNLIDAHIQSESLGLMLENEHDSKGTQWIFMGVSHISNSQQWEEGHEVYSTEFLMDNEYDLRDYLSRQKEFLFENAELTEQINQPI
jgi:hypothetical protein